MTARHFDKLHVFIYALSIFIIIVYQEKQYVHLLIDKWTQANSSKIAAKKFLQLFLNAQYPQIIIIIIIIIIIMQTWLSHTLSRRSHWTSFHRFNTKIIKEQIAYFSFNNRKHLLWKKTPPISIIKGQTYALILEYCKHMLLSWFMHLQGDKIM